MKFYYSCNVYSSASSCMHITLVIVLLWNTYHKRAEFCNNHIFVHQNNHIKRQLKLLQNDIFTNIFTILHSSFTVTRQHITFSVWQSVLELSGFEDNFCSVSNMTLNTYFFKLQSHTVPQPLRKKTTALFHVVFGLTFWTLKS